MKTATQICSRRLAPVAEQKQKRYQVTLDPDLVRKIGVIASLGDTSIPDWVNNALRPLVEKELPRALKKLGASPEED